MNSAVCIEQKGIVESVNNQRIVVRIDRGSACGHCSANGICNMAESTERVIELKDSTQTFAVGEWVGITISRSMGNKAVILGYLIPFVLLISSLLIFTAFKLSEWIVGVSSLLTLVPYFIILSLFRERLRKTFTFSIHKAA
jgi:sigma-E factor negative regulatory protein RseC